MSSKASQSTDNEAAVNRPRNHLVTDATKNFDFSFTQYGKISTITVNQTPDEETWPGGALWDIGVLLSHVFVGIAGLESPGLPKIPSRLIRAFPSTKDLSVLELGCGVGLTGLVAAAAMGTQLTILTDLKVVVDKVAKPNMLMNTIPPTNANHPYRITTMGKRGRVMSMPLCWGSEEDEKAVEATILELATPPKGPRKKKGASKSAIERLPGKPDIILIGDVAYQHGGVGAPSHFDALMSTVLKFLGPQTLVVFGTRMRMPASRDLLELFAKHMEEIVMPPICADEVDRKFAKFKHMITIHVFRKR